MLVFACASRSAKRSDGKNKTMWVTGSAVFGLLLNAGLNFWFVDRMGYSGAAWATVLTTYGVVALLLFPLCRALATTPLELFDWKHLFKVMAACALPGLGVYFCMDVLALQGMPRLFTGTAMYGVLVLAMYRLLRLATLRDLLDFLRTLQ